MDRDGTIPNYYYTSEYGRSPRPTVTNATSALATAAAGFLFLCLVYQAFGTLEVQDWAWNILVNVIPTRLLLDSAALQTETTKGGDMHAHIHAAKSVALRKMFGLEGGALRTAVQVAQRSRALSVSHFGLSPSQVKLSSEKPPGLGNWDNSCYQNSVLQCLAALTPLRLFVRTSSETRSASQATTTLALQTLLDQLNDEQNNSGKLWTPAKLKSMSSWQQQDAQEYFSKLMDELDKETPAVRNSARGLTDAISGRNVRDSVVRMNANPLDGLLAQRVACTRCGFTEGISMTAFNCLTVPLGAAPEYDIRSCLREYAQLEEIGEVECSKCTLLAVEQQLQQMISSPRGPETVPEEATHTTIPSKLHQQAQERLDAVHKALADDDYSDKTVYQTCQVSKKARVSSTKTRQAVIGRAPQSLAIHVNRSVFDEMTGAQRKNYANVRFPLSLDVSPYILNHDSTDGSNTAALAPTAQASTSLLSSSPQTRVIYRLCSVITHFGRHENGHYIAYRQHPSRSGKPTWWRLSDEDVSEASEGEVLDQGGVFMLFYDKEMVEPPPLVSTLQGLVEQAHQATLGKEGTEAEEDVAVTNSKPLLDQIAVSTAGTDPVTALTSPASLAPLPAEPQTVNTAHEDPGTQGAPHRRRRSSKKSKFMAPIRPMLTT